MTDARTESADSGLDRPSPQAAAALWREFADSIPLNVGAKTFTWSTYAEDAVKRRHKADEISVVRPSVFEPFLNRILGWTLNTDLFPEHYDVEGSPDYTPIDPVTHPFVFEAKGTDVARDLSGYREQVKRYLQDGAPRIRRVVLTNLLSLQVFDLDSRGNLHQEYDIDMVALLHPESAHTDNAANFANFLYDFHRQQLSPSEKLERVRQASEWSVVPGVTSGEWVLARLEQVLGILTQDVTESLGDIERHLSLGERNAIRDELRSLTENLQDEQDDGHLRDFLDAPEGSARQKALAQYVAHVAYFAAVKLLIVRVWEDLGIIKDPVLYDGGFDHAMQYHQMLQYVVDEAYNKAGENYRFLFDAQNTYTWYKPHNDALANVIYELANTYFGDVSSDILGQVYERMLERINRKLLGVYYTPRDIIALMWDLIDLDAVAREAEEEDSAPRILDIATGSGGFLVEAAHRLRNRLHHQLDDGARVDFQGWLADTASSLMGVEIGRFPAYLAELNLLIQFAQAVAAQPNDRTVSIPEVEVLCADTLSLHDTELPLDGSANFSIPLVGDQDRQPLADRIVDAANQGLMDVAIGNPPYIGQKRAASVIRATRARHSYWNQYHEQKMDYLYWFIILGVSKLRVGGRFAFITTEYWLRADGARPLRKYLAQRCRIDRIILLRDFRPFDDAQGQLSMIVTGTRMWRGNDGDGSAASLDTYRPTVSIYTGGQVSGTERASLLRALRDGRKRGELLSHRQAPVSPNALGGDSWADVILTSEELRQRRQIAKRATVKVAYKQGFVTTNAKLGGDDERLMTIQQIKDAGGPGSRHGIQMLSAAEVAALGSLNDRELEVLRPVVNTKDVYPYAVVLPDSPDYAVWLTRKDAAPLIAEGASVDVVRATPLPDGIPKIAAHMEIFRNVLMGTLTSSDRYKKERRPWWTLHNPRGDPIETIGREWADYPVVANWGGGGSFAAGLTPGGAAPSRGLNMVLSKEKAFSAPAAYLVGILNSTLFRDLSASIPPGYTRSVQLEALPVSWIPANANEIGEKATELAGLVTTMVAELSKSFPQLPSDLRTDIALATVSADVWQPRGGAKQHWGTLSSVRWLGEVQHARPSVRLGSVHVREILVGTWAIEVEMYTGTKPVVKPTRALSITLRPDATEDERNAVAAAMRGLSVQSKTVQDALFSPMPVSGDILAAQYHNDLAALTNAVERYRQLRADIDRLIA